MHGVSEALNSVWGSLAEPIHTEPPPEGRPAFRDNAFLGDIADAAEGGAEGVTLTEQGVVRHIF